MLLAPIVLEERRRASLGETPSSEPAVREGVALGLGLGIVAVGAFASYQLYKNDQVPAAAIAGLATLGIGPKLASALV